MPYSLMICVLLLQQIPVWRLVQDLKIGSVDDPEYAFTAAFDVVVRNEVAYSVHENEQRLRMWDARGKLIREIGRSGRGPGEFSGPVRAGWRGDTLWIYDSRQSRISLFKPTGEFVRSITAVAKVQPGAKASSNLRARYLLADGTLLGQPTILASASSDNKPDQSAFVRFRESGEILDTLAKYEVRRNTVEVRSGDARMYSVQPFTDSPLPVIGGRGRAVYIINRDYPRSNAKATFRITKIGLRGDTLFDKRFEYEPSR